MNGKKMDETELCEVQVSIQVVVFRPRSVKWAGHTERETGEQHRKLWLGNP
jgi:hypothetical protein